MIASLIIIILITVAIVSRCYLKYSFLESFALLMSSIIGLLVAFTFYETVGTLAVNKGFMIQSAHGMSLMILYILTTAIVAVICSRLVGSKIDLGNAAKVIAALVCGLLTSIISSGVVVAAFGMQPPGPMSYNRFDDRINLQNPKTLIVSADALATSLYGWMADGAMASKKKFSLYHADYLDQMHINRHRAAKGAAAIAGKDAISIPRNGVKIEEKDEDKITLVRVKIKNSKIPKGGAADKVGKVAVTPGQFRLVCQKKNPDGSFSGQVKILYPITYRVAAAEDNSTKKVEDLGQFVLLERDDFIGKTAPVDLAFDIPSNITARYLQFRNNVMVEVPRPATEEQLEENDPFKENS